MAHLSPNPNPNPNPNLNSNPNLNPNPRTIDLAVQEELEGEKRYVRMG